MESYDREIVERYLEELLEQKLYHSVRCFNNEEWALFQYLDKRDYIIIQTRNCAMYANEHLHKVQHLDYLITPQGIAWVKKEEILKKHPDKEMILEWYIKYEKLRYLSYKLIGSIEEHLQYRYPIIEHSYSKFIEEANKLFAKCDNFEIEEFVRLLRPFTNKSLVTDNEKLIGHAFYIYMRDRNIVWNDKLDKDEYLNISSILFGNGNSINFLSEDLKTYKFNNRLMQNEELRSVTCKLLKCYNELVYNKIGKEEVVAFCLNKPLRIDQNEYWKEMQDNPNRYLLLLQYLVPKIIKDDAITINDVGFEKLELISKFYYTNKKELKQWMSLLHQEVFNAIKDIQDENGIDKISNHSCIAEKLILTTNYDNVLERQLLGCSVVHLHGSIASADIVIGGEYEDKLEGTLQLDELKNASGVFAFVGFGLEFNDEHLLKIFRANRKITKFIYFLHEKKNKTEDEKIAINRKLTVLLNNAHNINRQIEVYDVSEFYNFYR